MKKRFLFFTFYFLIFTSAKSQNVGVNITSPSEKLHVDSGNIKIGNAVWQSAANARFLKFGDGGFVTLGEEEGDDKLTIRSKELLIRPSSGYNTVPVTIQGSTNFSHFYFGSNEDTYIRGGKSTSNLILGDGGGRTGINVYPQRAMLEQNGAVGVTAALFGGESSGISLQRAWPAIGFNHWYDGTHHRSIGTGYAGQLAVNPGNGTIQYSTWDLNAAIPNAMLDIFPQSITTNFFITRTGAVGIGTDAPATPLHIKAPLSVLRLEEVSTYNPTWDIYPYAYPYVDGLFRGFSALCFSRPNTSAIQACIDYDGTYYYDSDRKLKKNIEYLNTRSYLQRIMQLKPAYYNMEEDPAGMRKSYGFISQDMEKIFPEVVKDTKNAKLMGYTKLIPILTKGIQEQQLQIESLQKENAAIREREGNLVKDLQQLKKQIELLSQQIRKTTK